MIASQAAKWCAVDPLRQKFSKEEKAAFTKSERGMYKSAYELRGESHATAVLRRHFMAQAALDAAPAAEAEAGAPASADGAGPSTLATPAVTRKEAAPPAPAPAAVAVVAEIVSALEPPTLGERRSGQLLLAGSAAWEDVGKRSLTAEESMLLPSFHTLLVGVPIALVVCGPSACHVLAISAEGAAYTWGRNSSGQLGLGHANPVASPQLVPFGAPKGAAKGAPAERIVGAALGKAHTLFVGEKGGLWACGSNSAGQLGVGASVKVATTSQLEAPRPVHWPASAARVSRVACGSHFSVATDILGALFSWGHPQYGQLGHGSKGEFLEKAGKIDYEFRTEPLRVTATSAPNGAALPPIGSLGCGDHHTVACTATGDVYTWGFGGYGRLGLEDQSDRLRPTLVSFKHKVRVSAVIAGGSCCYAQTTAGGTFFWGRTKSTGEATMYPKLNGDLQGWSLRSLACGKTSTLVAADTSLISWGPSPTYGELGYGLSGPKSSTTPKLVDELTGATVLQVASGYACSALVCATDDEASRSVIAKLAAYEVALAAAKQALPDSNPPTAKGKAKAGAKAAAQPKGKGKGKAVEEGDSEEEGSDADGGGDDDYEDEDESEKKQQSKRRKK